MLSQHRSNTNRLSSKRQLYHDSWLKEKSERERLDEEIESTQQAQEIVQLVSQAIQNIVHSKVAEIVSDCLEAVFDDPYEFRIEFERKRGKTEARVVFVRNGVELDDPLNQVGGGVIDVAAFALRLACLLLRRPVYRRILILDEPMKNVRGESYRKRVAILLERLAKDLGVQIILNTDVPTFRLGKVVEMGDG